MTTAASKSSLSMEDVAKLRERFEDRSASELLDWALETYGTGLAVASSFGAEDIVLIDLAVAVDPDVRIFTLDTGRLHQETYDTIDRVRAHFDVDVEVLFPEHDVVERFVHEQGLNAFYDSVASRKTCCRIRKVEPLGRMLAELDAWVTGVRRDQNVTREDVAKVELDLLNGGLLKLNPLADWTEDDVWGRIRDRELPYNPLHDQGFPSIGCAPCTRPVDDGEDARAGRWWWEDPDQKECGLHARDEH